MNDKNLNISNLQTFIGLITGITYTIAMSDDMNIRLELAGEINNMLSEISKNIKENAELELNKIDLSNIKFN